MTAPTKEDLDLACGISMLLAALPRSHREDMERPEHIEDLKALRVALQASSPDLVAEPLRLIEGMIGRANAKANRAVCEALGARHPDDWSREALLELVVRYGKADLGLLAHAWMGQAMEVLAQKTRAAEREGSVRRTPR